MQKKLYPRRRLFAPNTTYKPDEHYSTTTSDPIDTDFIELQRQCDKKLQELQNTI